MASAGGIIKVAGTAVATTVTLLTALKDNPQLASGLGNTLNKLRSATSSENPRLRFEGKIAAIEACADAVDDVFPGSAEPEIWRRKARSLQVRGNLAWGANRGRERKQAMRRLDVETAELLGHVNQRLVEMTDDDPATPAITTDAH